MQREPSLQSLSYWQYFAPFTRSLGALSSSPPELSSMLLHSPFTHWTPGFQSVSNTQAKVGVEMRQKIVTMIMRRIAIPSQNLTQ